MSYRIKQEKHKLLSIKNANPALSIPKQSDTANNSVHINHIYQEPNLQKSKILTI